MQFQVGRRVCVKKKKKKSCRSISIGSISVDCRIASHTATRSIDTKIIKEFVEDFALGSISHVYIRQFISIKRIYSRQTPKRKKKKKDRYADTNFYRLHEQGCNFFIFWFIFPGSFARRMTTDELNTSRPFTCTSALHVAVGILFFWV